MIGTKVLEEKESKYNGHLKVVKTFGLGTYIQTNGLTQSGGIVESMWQHTLRKLKRSIPVVQKSLILGLGGGSVVRAIRKNWPESKITGVDIDPKIIELGEKYLNLDKNDIEIKIADAYGFDATGYDLVIVDLYCGTEFPKKFEDNIFLNKLKKGKAVVVNRTYYKDKKIEAVRFGKKLEKIFKKVEWFYPEVNLMFFCFN